MKQELILFPHGNVSKQKAALKQHFVQCPSTAGMLSANMVNTQSHLCHHDQLAQTCSLLCLPALLHREGIQFSPQKDMPTLGLCRPAVTKDIDVEPNYLANIRVPLQHYTHSSLQQPHRLSEPLHPSSLLTVTCQTQNNTWINMTASMKQLTQLCPQLPCGWLT